MEKNNNTKKTVRLVLNKPVALTILPGNKDNTYKRFYLCYMVFHNDIKELFWRVKPAGKSFSKPMNIDVVKKYLMNKYDIPYIENVKDGDVVEISHMEILEDHGGIYLNISELRGV